MTYRVKWEPSAQKTLRKIEKSHQAVIVRWVSQNLDGSDNPRVVGDAVAIKGVKDGWRWRVGRYRIMGVIIDDQVIIELFRISKRGGAYDNLPQK